MSIDAYETHNTLIVQINPRESTITVTFFLYIFWVVEMNDGKAGQVSLGIWPYPK